VRLLLDSHILLWWLGDDPRLGSAVREAVTDGANEVAVSAASTWEISIKQALGKLSAPDDLAAQVEREGFSAWPITLEDGTAAGRLPRHHDDPFDRMLIAQARRRQFTIATVDQRFAAYDVDLLPA
jgi:PIN domain nuclease of toxin-antitoxin system